MGVTTISICPFDSLFLIKNGQFCLNPDDMVRPIAESEVGVLLAYCLFKVPRQQSALKARELVTDLVTEEHLGFISLWKNTEDTFDICIIKGNILL